METRGPGASAENGDNLENEEYEEDELSLGLTEDGMILLEGSDWEVELTPEAARELGAALLELSDEAEKGDQENGLHPPPGDD
jgi:hypothetical protein